MLGDNIKNLRKAQGFSQEELANRINVVRQTVSKWENGKSVPDSEMLVKIAEVLNTTVNELLESHKEKESVTDIEELAAKVEIIDKQIAQKKELRRKMWRMAFFILAILAFLSLLKELTEYIYLWAVMSDMRSDVSSIGGFDGPTQIYVTGIWRGIGRTLVSAFAVAVSCIGIYKMRRKRSET